MNRHPSARWPYATLSVAAALAAPVAGCRGSFGDPPGGEPPGGDKTGDSAQAQCIAGKLDVGASPMRRLTRFEYDNSVRDLLGDTTMPAKAFAPDEQVGGFDANAIAPVSQSQIEQYMDAAAALSTTAIANKLGEWISCDTTKTPCVQSFIESFGKRAFRRPLEPETTQNLVSLYESASAQWDALTGIRLVIQAILVSPQFLYHVELGLPSAQEAVVPLTGFELASRLSYFIWQSMPDDDLLAAAEAGALDAPDGIEAQARRMLADPKAKDGIASFHTQWLELGRIDDLTKDGAMFPAWNPELVASMRAETLAFVDGIVRTGDANLDTLLTATYSYVDAPLAALYGVPAPAGGALAKVDLDPAQRAGILTQASFLAGHAHATEPSWVHRGKFVRENLLCQRLPSPPPNVDMSKLQDPDRTTNPDCKGCHTLMDPIGYGFDHYDAIGAFVDKPAAGIVVDPNGDLDVGGPFNGAVELAGKLAKSEDARDCVATQWLRYAARRDEAAEDACSLDAVRSSFADGGKDLQELVVAIAKADIFRYRRAVQ